MCPKIPAFGITQTIADRIGFTGTNLQNATCFHFAVSTSKNSLSWLVETSENSERRKRIDIQIVQAFADFIRVCRVHLVWRPSVSTPPWLRMCLFSVAVDIFTVGQRDCLSSIASRHCVSQVQVDGQVHSQFVSCGMAGHALGHDELCRHELHSHFQRSIFGVPGRCHGAQLCWPGSS